MADTYPTNDEYAKEVLKSDGGRKDPRTFIPKKSPEGASSPAPSAPAPRARPVKGPSNNLDLDPRSNKTIKQLEKEAKDRKKAKESAKKYLQKNKKSSGRGSGTAELMELHTGGRKKERVKQELIAGMLATVDKMKPKRKKSKKGPR